MEIAVSETNAVPEQGWRTGVHSFLSDAYDWTFYGLKDDTTYYVFSRYNGWEDGVQAAPPAVCETPAVVTTHKGPEMVPEILVNGQTAEHATYGTPFQLAATVTPGEHCETGAEIPFSGTITWYEIVNGQRIAADAQKPILKDAGTYSYVAAGIDDHFGNIGHKFESPVMTVTVNPKQVAPVVEVQGGPFVYQAEPHTPEVTVKDGEQLLTAGSDYEVSYADNVNAGENTAKVIVTLKGNYQGTGEASFSIAPKSIVPTVEVADAGLVYTGENLEPAVTAADGDRTLVQGTDYEVLYTNNRDAGKGDVIVTLKGNYQGQQTARFTIAKSDNLPIPWPDKAELLYGEPIHRARFDNDRTYGAFHWANPEYKPEWGTETATMTFTPSPETLRNYNAQKTSKEIRLEFKKVEPVVDVTVENITGEGAQRTITLGITVSKNGVSKIPTGTVSARVTGGANLMLPAQLENGKATLVWTGAEADKSYYFYVMYHPDTHFSIACNEITVDTRKQPQAALTIADPGTKTYGDAPFALNVSGGSGGGAVSFESDNPNILRFVDGKAVISGTGFVIITATKAGDDRYIEAKKTIELAIQPRPLTVTADSQTIWVGDASPRLSYTTTGLVAGDQFETEPTLHSEVDTLRAGTYPIVFTEGVMDDKYLVTYVSGTLTVARKSYQITQGAGQSIWMGSAGTFTSDASHEIFVGVEVDGTMIANTNYTWEEGSTKVTLNAAYLKTLSAGAHRLRIVSTDGDASTTFTMLAPSVSQTEENVVYDSDSPKTGDITRTGLWLGLAAVGMLGLTATMTAKKYFRKRR